MNDDVYCYPESNVLKNKLNIPTEDALAVAETDLSRAKMQALYEMGLQNFRAQDLLFVHRFLFEDVYEWAGCYRVINISKKEPKLAGLSVWYTDALDLPSELERACAPLVAGSFHIKNRRHFCRQLAQVFSTLWKVHPFREGNTRTTVAFLTLFVESKGLFVDKQLLMESAGYIRNAFVTASAAEPDILPLEHILLDAVSQIPFTMPERMSVKEQLRRAETYKKYDTKEEKAQPHQIRDKEYNPKDYSI